MKAACFFLWPCRLAGSSPGHLWSKSIHKFFLACSALTGYPRPLDPSLRAMNDFAVIHLILRLFVLAAACMLMASPARARQLEPSKSDMRSSQPAGRVERDRA